MAASGHFGFHALPRVAQNHQTLVAGGWSRNHSFWPYYIW